MIGISRSSTKRSNCSRVSPHLEDAKAVPGEARGMQQESLNRSAHHDALVEGVVVCGRSVGLLLEPLLHDGDGHAYSLVDGDQAILSAAAGARQLRPVTCAFAAQAT
jgi:hypothetical protein